MLCSRTDRDAVVACLVSGPQMHATPRLQQGLRESKFHCHGFQKASVNQQTIAASDLPQCPRNLLQMIGGPMRRTAVVDHTHFL